jgi:predicted metal-binding membrane protein
MSGMSAVMMMVPMMLPSLAPTLWHYRQTVSGRLIALVGAGYVFVWMLLGVAAIPLSAALMRAAPLTIGVLILIAGAFQFTPWKAHHLACCRDALRCDDTLSAAWRHGLRLGVHCCCCCAGLMTILLGVGMMNPWAMAGVTAAITAERLAPSGIRVARLVGVVVIASGLFVTGWAMGLRASP